MTPRTKELGKQNAMRITDVSGVFLKNEALAYKWMLKWFLISVLVQRFSENERNYFLLVTGQLLWWPSGPAQSRRRVSCPALSSKAQQPMWHRYHGVSHLAAGWSPKNAVKLLSQVQQSMAVCCCVLIHKSNGSDIGMVLSGIQTWAIPYFDISPQLSALSSVCIKDKFSESSSVSYQISSFFIYLSFPSNTVCSVL